MYHHIKSLEDFKMESVEGKHFLFGYDFFLLFSIFTFFIWKIDHHCCLSLIFNQERVKEGREIFSIIVTLSDLHATCNKLSFYFHGLWIIRLFAFCFNDLCNLTSLFIWGHHQLKNTTPTTLWFLLQLLWILLQALNFHKMRFFSIA